MKNTVAGDQSDSHRTAAHRRIPEAFPEDWASDWGQDRYGLWMSFRYKGVRQCLRWIEPGQFMMGSPERHNDEQQHEVIHTHGFWLADTACTQALWNAVMGGNPSNFKREDRPVDTVSWEGAKTFIEKINGQIPGLELQLPTEAQWEYACRAGTTTPFHFGETITTDQVNFNGEDSYNNGKEGEYRKKTVSVKSFACNTWGLYEMHGNVWEWCADWHGDYPQDTVVDPLGPETGDSRVLRGGSWIDNGRSVRSACRDWYGPADGSFLNGFRVARGQTASMQSSNRLG